jgi:hypothetical protein
MAICVGCNQIDGEREGTGGSDSTKGRRVLRDRLKRTIWLAAWENISLLRKNVSISPHDPAAMAGVGGHVSVVVGYDPVAIDSRRRSAKSLESFS